jgi:hypothetical protein
MTNIAGEMSHNDCLVVWHSFRTFASKIKFQIKNILEL